MHANQFLQGIEEYIEIIFQLRDRELFSLETQSLLNYFNLQTSWRKLKTCYDNY